MNSLTSKNHIRVPKTKPEQQYKFRILNKNFSFLGLKHLLGAADFSKAGERNAGLCAANDVEREAARSILSSLTLEHLYDHPLTDERGHVDSVMTINYDIDLNGFAQIASKRLGEIKDDLLNGSNEDALLYQHSLTGVMAAALAKLLDVHELIFIAKKFSNTTKARTTLGLPGTLSSRLQPNHPCDDLNGVTLLVYSGLSIGSGDALIGLNPAIDTVDNVSKILHHLAKMREKLLVPTQICVLSHIKTQLTCLEQGAPTEIMFQSLAGTENALLTEFDVNVDLLDRAFETMATRGPLGPQAEQFMYFETGQGSEFSYGKHNGIDMTTSEALCYGLARRYDPFMVNNVTGFIGPETHVDNFEMIIANLQDHFMGKIMGLPMGMAPCFTMHSKIGLEGQQIATELLTAAGANYYMDVCHNTDRMLAYFDTSGHDNQTLREIYNKRTTPEFEQWALAQGIFLPSSNGIKRGPNWGKPSHFCDKNTLYELKKSTPFYFNFCHAGPRSCDQESRAIKLNHALARETVFCELKTDELVKKHHLRLLTTAAKNKEMHLNFPHYGARLSKESAQFLKSEGHDVQIIISDGLSTEAIHENIDDLLPVLRDGLKSHGLTEGQPILALFGRVKLAETVARIQKSSVTIFLIGERPGGDAHASRSLSAYIIYQLLDPKVKKIAQAFSKNSHIEFEYSLISNIYPEGLPAIEAGSVIIEKVLQILKHHAAGNRLLTML